MTEVVQIKNVTKVINGNTIVDNISFSVPAGEVFGFLGPNGAGKTTSIRMMVGLVAMTEGDIFIQGKSIKNEFEQAIAQVGAIVENPELYKFLSGYQNLLHFARMSQGITKKKIDETVELVGLTDRIHDKVKTYSLGMRQRLGLAQCLLHDPKVLILDEPTNGLDPAGIREIRDHLRILAAEKKMAVIVSSHLLSEMEMMCDRIGIIQKGKLIDVQLISDFVRGKGEQFKLEVNKIEQAAAVIAELYPEMDLKTLSDQIIVSLPKEKIPSIIEALVHQNIKIFGVEKITKTLEDRFLEVTEKEGIRL
ncbi:ABC transporter ATP-binding protein [Bacillaceae bacterium Marseille-Q3522]|nr:ABC transporter ATP-binding protein [Bacillaceae bacterium Marseille-Q3522]